MKNMNRFPMIVVKNIVKSFKRLESLTKTLKNICLNLVTVFKRSIYEVVWFVEFFSIIWG